MIRIKKTLPQTLKSWLKSYRIRAVAVLFLALGVGVLWYQHGVQAAGGVFTIAIEPVNNPVLSGQNISYRIDYSCSGATESDTCDDVFLTVPRPAGVQYAAPANVSVSGSSQTVSNTFAANGTAQWQFIPAIPPGSAGQLTVSWDTATYNNPNGTVATATVEHREGAFDAAVIQSQSTSITINSTADWGIAKTPSNGAPITIGYPYTYTIGLYYAGANQDGRLALENVVYQDQLPPTAEFISASDGGTYDSATHTVTWPSFSQGANVGTTTQSASQTNPAYTRTITVRYNAANNTDASTVTNNASYTANSIGQSDTQTNTTSRSNLLTATPVYGMLFSKTPDTGVEVTPGQDSAWILRLNNTGNTPMSGTITENVPCADDTGAIFYQSPSDPAAACATPAFDITNINPGNNSSVKITAFHWRTNTGASGSYTTPLTQGQTVSKAMLGIPTNQVITSISMDYEMVAGPVSITPIISATFDDSLNPGDTVRNISSFTATDGVSFNTTGSDSGQIVIRDKQPVVTTSIYDTAGSGVVYRPATIINWTANYQNTTKSSGADGKPVQPDWYIAVPVNLRYIDGSIKFTNLPDSLGQPEIIESYPGTGNLENYTIVHVRWPDGSELPTGPNVTGSTTNRITMTFDTLVEPNTPENTYSGKPPTTAQAATTQSRGIYSAAYAAGEPVTLAATGNSIQNDDVNYDQNATTTAVPTANASWQVGLAATAFADIEVQGAEDSAYNNSGMTHAGGANNYRINLMNASNDGSSLTNLIFYSSLPRIGDNFISQNLDNQPRESTTNVYLSGPVIAPAGVTVLYSRSTNPCRDEVYPDSANAGCVNDWVTADQITDWSTVTFMKFTLSGVYEQGQGEMITIPTVTDGDALVGDQAYMSVAYQATNTANGTTLLPAESPRVLLQVVGMELTVSKTADPATGAAVQVGQTVTYTVRAENTGDVTMSPATVTDNLSDVLDNATLNSGSITVNGPAGAPAATMNGTTLTWAGNLAPGEVVTITYQVTINDNQGGQELRNSVIAEADDGTGNTTPSNCELGTEAECTTTHTIAAQPALVVEKTDNATSVVPGRELTYTITVRNATVGTEPITNVAVEDRLPAGVTFVSASDGGTLQDGAVHWTIPSVASDAPQTRSVTVRVNDSVADGTTIANQATVSTPDDPTICERTASNCQATDTTEVDTPLIDALGDGLAFTGQPMYVAIIAALLCLVGGVASVVIVRRRRA